QSPELENADEAERAMIAAIIGLMRLLTWQDFELLVDLVFSASGWRRVLSGCNRYMGSRARCVKYTIANIGDAGLGCAPIRSMAPSLWMQRPPHSGIRSGG
ncbi:MAG: hypothetical protein GC190_19460, partial [Alphaproteobacteria bacterium]|nr:hypothetical protein [Alphaproteobacteria bacterium]